MPIDKDKIKKALDDFENDDFVSSKEKIRDEIKKAKDEYVKDKTGLKNEIDPHEDKDDEDKDDEDKDEDKDKDEE